MPAHSFCVQRASFRMFCFLQPLCCIHKRRKGKKKDLISLATKCLWGRLLVLAVGKELLERRISVPWWKRSPWQPAIKALATFSQTLRPGGPFPSLGWVFASASKSFFASTLPIKETLRPHGTVLRCLIYSVPHGAFGREWGYTMTSQRFFQYF